MSYDGLVTRVTARELNTALTGGKIDKIHQPARDEIVISIRAGGGAYKLLCSANPGGARCHLTEATRENPAAPPMFCMLLRKHLAGGKVVSVEQSGTDRVIRIDMECYNELGDKGVKSLIVEVMGKHSNIILVDGSNKIIDSIKHVDLTTSALRQILPGLFYEPPPKRDAVNPFGFSPLLLREAELCGGAENFSYVPTVVFDGETPVAFSCVDLNQYGEGHVKKHYENVSECMDAFFTIRDDKAKLRQSKAALLKPVQNHIERVEKKLKIHRENLLDATNRDKYKLYGDLLTTNMHKISYGMRTIEVENYLDGMNEITINLKENLSPSQNAQRYYTRYNKAKTTEKYALMQIAEAEEEREYLESVIEAIDKVSAPAELAEIRGELAEQGYVDPGRTVRGKTAAKKKPQTSYPMEFVTSDGFTVLVGKNNKQNDALTLKTAYSTDIWLHTKAIPGSHVIIRANGGAVSDAAIREAAELAAYYSKAKTSAQVPVDYTEVKNVKKPNGAKPGMVIYDRYNTVYVTPTNSP